MSTRTQDSESISAGGSKIWRTYDDGYIVRSMRREDAVLVQDWYNKNMGQLSRYDLDITLSCHPVNAPGFYIGEFKGEVVAAAVRLPWGENIMYGSYYYVDERYRSNGFGTRLRDEVAREFVGNRILCVDACQGKVTTNNLSKFGYTLGYEAYRYEGLARASYDDVMNGSTNDESFTLVKGSQIDFEKLISFDNECFVSRDFPIRREFLRQWISIPDGATYVAINSTGHVVGYGCRHPAIKEDQQLIGPLYGSSSSIAESILAKLCSDVAGQNVTINVTSRNTDALDLLRKFGIKELFALNRMYLNGTPEDSNPRVYALTSIDICGF